MKLYGEHRVSGGQLLVTAQVDVTFKYDSECVHMPVIVVLKHVCWE